MDYDEEERAKKQQYLASEILEQGYDGLEFKGFLDAKKENKHENKNCLQGKSGGKSQNQTTSNSCGQLVFSCIRI